MEEASANVITMTFKKPLGGIRSPLLSMASIRTEFACGACSWEFLVSLCASVLCRPAVSLHCMLHVWSLRVRADLQRNSCVMHVPCSTAVRGRSPRFRKISDRKCTERGRKNLLKTSSRGKELNVTDTVHGGRPAQTTAEVFHLKHSMPPPATGRRLNLMISAALDAALVKAAARQRTVQQLSLIHI